VEHSGGLDTRRLASRATIYILAVIVAVWVLGPIFWILKSSLSTQTDLLNVPPDVLPRHWTFDNYLGMFINLPGGLPGQEKLIPPALLNSLIIASSVLIINLAVATPAAYVLARQTTPFHGFIVNALLASRLVPTLVLLVPFYLLFRSAHLIDTLAGVVIAHTAVSVPFTIWILRGYFDNVPVEIERAAQVDGCGRFQTFLYVAVPLAKAGLVVAGLFAFMLSWNEFALALVLTVSPASLPVQPTLAGLYSLQGATYVNYGYIFAGAILVAIPPAIIALLLQTQLGKGALEGSMK
jgi:multiple sugar transport system permease protein